MTLRTPTYRSLRAPLALALVVCAGGCRDLSRFDSKPGAAYCGAIIGTPEFQDGLLPAGPPNLTLKLTLDTAKLNSEPGILSSNDEANGAPGIRSNNDEANGLCPSRGEPLFRDSPLRAIPQIDHDVLSTMSFGE